MTTKVLTRRDHYAADMALVVRQRDDDSQATLQIRRVAPYGKEELQIEICLEKFHKKRTVSMSVSFCAAPDIADKIALACAAPKQPTVLD